METAGREQSSCAGEGRDGRGWGAWEKGELRGRISRKTERGQETKGLTLIGSSICAARHVDTDICREDFPPFMAVAEGSQPTRAGHQASETLNLPPKASNPCS